jgi:hypothetical protein
VKFDVIGLIRERLTEGEFERFLAGLVPLPDPTPDRTDGGRGVHNAERVREAIRTAYRAAPDLDTIRGTRWGALQAVTAYVTSGTSSARFFSRRAPPSLRSPARPVIHRRVGRA